MYLIKGLLKRSIAFDIFRSHIKIFNVGVY